MPAEDEYAICPPVRSRFFMCMGGFLQGEGGKYLKEKRLAIATRALNMIASAVRLRVRQG